MGSKPGLTALILAMLVFASVPAVLEFSEGAERGAKVHGTRGTLIVGPGQAYTSIQDAVDAASAGDTVRVHNGIYYEQIVVNKQLNIIGNGSGSIVSGGKIDTIMRIEADNCLISRLNFTEKGDFIEYLPIGGLKILSNYNTIRDCFFFNNNNFGLYLSGSSINLIENCSFVNNHVNGLYLICSNGNTIKNCTTSGHWYDGIYVSSSCNNTILDSMVYYSGNGITFLNCSNSIIENCVCFQNQGGIVLALCSNFTINNCVAYENLDNYYFSNSHHNIISKSKAYAANSFSYYYNSGTGMNFDRSNNNTVFQCMIENNSYTGIELYISDENNISDCTVSNNRNLGISLGGADKNLIQDCSLLSDSDLIGLGDSSENIIENVHLTSMNGFGCQIDESNDNSIRNSTFNGNSTKGVSLLDSNSVEIVNNEFYNCGVLMNEGGYGALGGYNISENLVNGRPLLYLENKDNATINITAGQIILVNCSDILVTNKTLTDTSAGLQVFNSHDCTFINNNCSDCYIGGPVILSYNCTFINNKYNDCDIGGRVELSDNALFKGCKCNKNKKEGLYILNSDGIAIDDCEFNNNNADGIYISQSRNSLLCDNVIDSNAGNGVYVIYSDNCIMKSNCMRKNKEYGVYSYYTWARLYSNTFEKCGVRLYPDSEVQWTKCEIPTNNTVNGRPLFYLKNTNGGTINTPAGQIIIINCTNIVVKAQDLSESTLSLSISGSGNISLVNLICNKNGDYGVNINDVMNIVFKNCSADNNEYYGFLCSRASNITFENCSFSNNGIDGIYIYNSDILYIKDCEGNNNDIGLNSYCDWVDIRGSFFNSNQESGIYLTNSANCNSYNRIQNCTFLSNGNGAYIYYYFLFIFQDCVFKDNQDSGLRLYQCQMIDIRWCNFSNNSEGITFYHDEGDTISNSSFYGNIVGMSIAYSDNLVIKDNHFTQNSDYAILVWYSGFNTLSNNKMFGCGIKIEGYSDSDWNTNKIDTSNTVNNRSVYYLKSISAFYFPAFSAGQIILFQCSSITISHQNLTNCSIGIFARNMNTLEISNCDCSYNTYGVYFENSCDDLRIKDTKADYCIMDGLYSHADVDIYNCTFNDNRNGIYIKDTSYAHVDNCTMRFNKERGIYIDNIMASTIISCSLINNMICGMELIDSQATDISGSTFAGSQNGLVLSSGSRNNDIYQNNFIENINYGVQILRTPNNNTITQNNFINNNGGFKQAFDNGSDNVWNGDVEGNYWSEWTSPDSDNDGIVDIPYNISGFANAIDNHPLAKGYGSPKISTKNQLSIYQDELYNVSYSAINTPSEDLLWDYASNASWLNFTSSHVLSGIPKNMDVGTYWVNITVSDGLFSDFTNFTLLVINVNDPPVIITEDVVTCEEYQMYSVKYAATDIDPTNDTLVWGLNTNAKFLSMNSVTGVLSGTPQGEDVGTYAVNVSVWDGQGGMDTSTFILAVLNVQDPPVVKDRPGNLTFPEDTVDTSIDLNSWFVDPFGEKLAFRGNDTPYISVSILNSGKVRLTPKANWSGQDTLTFYAQDSMFEISDTLKVRVSPVNDVPYGAKITLQETPYVVGGPQFVYGDAKDVDLGYGDELNFTWYCDTKGLIGSGQNVNLSLPVGVHTITLLVKDLAGAQCMVSKNITIVKNPTNIGNVTDDDTGNSVYDYIIPTFLVMVIIFTILLTAYLLNRKPEEEKPKEEEKKTKRYRRVRIDKEKLDKLMSELPEIDNAEMPPDPTNEPLFTGIPSADEVVDSEPHTKNVDGMPNETADEEQIENEASAKDEKIS